MNRIVTLTIGLSIIASASLYGFADSQLSKIDSLKARVKLESDAYELAYLYWEITEEYYSLDFDSSLHYANQYLNFSIQAEDSAWIADAYSYIAYVYDQHGDLTLAGDNFRKSLEMYIAIDDSIWIASCYNNLGYVISYGLDQAGGLIYFLKSMQIAESLQDSMLISDACCNVAYFYERIKDFNTASEYYQIALEMDIAMGDSTHIAMSYANMANINLILGKSRQAEVFMEEAKNNISSNHIQYELVYLYTTIADTYLEWSKPDSARKYIEISEGILDEHEFILISAYVARQNGFLCYLEEDYGSCVEYLDESISLYEEIGGLEPFFRIYTKKAEAYAKLYMYDEAYKAELMANEIYESLKYGEVSGILSRHEQEKLDNAKLENTQLAFALEKQKIDNTHLRTRSNLRFAVITIFLLLILAGIVLYSLYAIRKKNRVLNAKNMLIKKQKELLESHIEKLKISEEELIELNATKDKFFSIIAHDLKGPLTAIMGISDLYLTEKERMETEDIFPILESINTTSSFGVSLLDNLLEWARSQTGAITPKPTKLVYDSILGKLNDDFRAIAKGKRITFEFPQVPPPAVFADENMILTVMRNLIHNSIKYSHASGVIKVSTYTQENYLVTSIEDQGIGVSKKELTKLFTIDGHLRKVGTNNEQGSGLGLILCKEFIEKNQGAIWAEGQENKGCKFSFTLPLFDESNSSNH